MMTPKSLRAQAARSEGTAAGGPAGGARTGRQRQVLRAEAAEMTQPRRYLVRMALFLAAVTIVGALLFRGLEGAFLANAPLNGTIAAVLLLGVIYMFRQVVKLRPEVAWVEAQKRSRLGGGPQLTPQLLAPVARVLEERRGTSGPPLSTLAQRSLLDGMAARLEESRELSRYLIGLLIFLGLLGTFWGLLQTVNAVSNVIGDLSMSAGEDITMVFDDLQSGLEAPLSGMGTAFSSSLFGLAGSLVLGFLELQASQAQNRFYNEVEEWLSTLTRHAGPGAAGGDETSQGDSAPTAYLHALMAQMAENLESLHDLMETNEDERRQANQALVDLSERLGTLTDQMRTEQSLMARLAENQQELKPTLARLAEAANSGELGLDEATKQHVRNLETYMARITDEMSQGRTQAVNELRSELKVLARTVAASSDSGGGESSGDAGTRPRGGTARRER